MAFENILNPATEVEEMNFQNLLKRISAENLYKLKYGPSILHFFNPLSNSITQKKLSQEGSDILKEKVKEQSERKSEEGEGDFSIEYESTERMDDSDASDTEDGSITDSEVFDYSETSEMDFCGKSEDIQEEPLDEKRKELHDAKIARILHKVKKVIKILKISKKVDREGIIQDAEKILNQISPLKIRKHTVNQTTSVVVFFTIKKVYPEIGLDQVIESVKKTERSQTLSRSIKPNFSRNNPEILGISKLVQSLESRQRPYSQTTEGTIKSLCNTLNCPPPVEECALSLLPLSDDPSLASRHSASVAASLVLAAAKQHKLKLTLTRVSEVSGVSACTIRKAQKALLSLIKEKGLEGFSNF